MSAVRSGEYARAGMDKATTTAERRVAIYAATAASKQRLVTAYERWVTMFPGKAVVLWGLGRQLSDEPAKAEAAYLRAIALDPGFARAYVELGRIGEMRDDRARACDAYRKAADADPTSDYYFYLYTNALRTVDRAGFLQAVDELLARFPRSQWTSRALLTVSETAGTPEERIRALERLRRAFPAPDTAGALLLFNAYLANESAKGVKLARELAAASTRDAEKKTWADRQELAARSVRVRAFLDTRNLPDALRELETTVPAGVDTTPMLLLKARAFDAAGETDRAFAIVLELAARWPEPAVQAVLVAYGAKLGRSAADVERAVWAARAKAASPLATFDLERLAGGGRVRLGDYRGQVVLVNFWFPT
jgi:tetratricopeptide (TPR) repeat protein